MPMAIIFGGAVIRLSYGRDSRRLRRTLGAVIRPGKPAERLTSLFLAHGFGGIRRRGGDEHHGG